MSDQEKAKDLAEQAIDKAADGDEAQARKLVGEAKKIDPKAADTVADEAARDRDQAATYEKNRSAES